MLVPRWLGKPGAAGCVVRELRGGLPAQRALLRLRGSATAAPAVPSSRWSAASTRRDHVLTVGVVLAALDQLDQRRRAGDGDSTRDRCRVRGETTCPSTAASATVTTGWQTGFYPFAAGGIGYLARRLLQRAAAQDVERCVGRVPPRSASASRAASTRCGASVQDAAGNYRELLDQAVWRRQGITSTVPGEVEARRRRAALRLLGRHLRRRSRGVPQLQRGRGERQHVDADRVPALAGQQPVPHDVDHHGDRRAPTAPTTVDCSGSGGLVTSAILFVVGPAPSATSTTCTPT